jgi:type IV secretion system protein TrbI
MAENVIASQPDAPAEPTLRRNFALPQGVLQKNLKMFVYLAAVLLVSLAAFISSVGKKSPGSQDTTKAHAPQPTTQDNTESNVQDMKSQIQAERQNEDVLKAASLRDSPASSTTPVAQAGYAPTGTVSPNTCIPGGPCPPIQQGTMQLQLSPEQQQVQMLAAKERERADDARFASNLVYPRPAEPAQQASPTQSSSTPYDLPGRQASNFVPPDVQAKHDDPPGEYKRPLEANIDSATGQPYLIYEGSILDTVLMNRLDGDAVGPVKVLVSNPLYSHDHQHVIIPEGTVVLGEARKIGATGFGQQRRMAVVFHRLIMPDGYSVDLDQFHGLDQIGEEGLKDKVNNHYLQIFGTSIALGVIAGAGEITQGGGTITTSGSQAFTNGASGSVSQSATTILDRFLQIPPTITIREGHRVKVYFTQDMLLPAYSNHTIPQSF